MRNTAVNAVRIRLAAARCVYADDTVSRSEAGNLLNDGRRNRNIIDRNGSCFANFAFVFILHAHGVSAVCQTGEDVFVLIIFSVNGVGQVARSAAGVGGDCTSVNYGSQSNRCGFG